MNKFWVLEEPESPEANSRLAVWNEDDDIRYESIQCSLHPKDHRRAGALLTPVNAILPNREPYDFVWALWSCLVQQSVLNFFQEAGFNGYETVPAFVRFADPSRRAPVFRQLKATGYAGGPSLESGSRVLSVCPACGLTERSKVKEPSKFIDESRWDGSDFFRVDPYPDRIFVTDRVVRALRESPLRGWAAYTLPEMKEKFDISIPGPSPTERHSWN